LQRGSELDQIEFDGKEIKNVLPSNTTFTCTFEGRDEGEEDEDIVNAAQWLTGFDSLIDCDGLSWRLNFSTSPKIDPFRYPFAILRLSFRYPRGSIPSSHMSSSQHFSLPCRHSCYCRKPPSTGFTATHLTSLGCSLSSITDSQQAVVPGMDVDNDISTDTQEEEEEVDDDDMKRR